MYPTDPHHIVRERMSFFEHLCKEEVKSSTLRRVRPTSTTSLPQASHPPQKPKRTFMHTFKDVQVEVG
ncbi:hypothetical protein RB195_025707 [Necator americanus]|uniref:Uncharacterized protein n=1 Tax=Necator americanus TaxID=51031 RepID=A0ABR1ETH7_NECAM